jgi:hypothetical protein
VCIDGRTCPFVSRALSCRTSLLHLYVGARPPGRVSLGTRVCALPHGGFMSETPRIVFTLFSAHTDSMVAAWQRFAADLLPDTTAALGQHLGVRFSTEHPAGERSSADRSTGVRLPAVRLPAVQRGGSERGLRYPSLRGVMLPPRRVSGAATSTSSTDVSLVSGDRDAGTTAPKVVGVAQASLAAGSSASSLPASLPPARRGPSAGSSAPLGGVWRLLATNNREIARSVRVYPSFPEARTEVDRICAGREELVVAAVVGPDRGTRGWYATLGGEAVITCSRWYETSSSSIAASMDAIEALQSAVIVDAVRTIESADRRRSRARVTEQSVVGW